MENWINLISNLGFPIAVTLFQLLKLDRSLQELKNEISKLSTEIKNAGK